MTAVISAGRLAGAVIRHWRKPLRLGHHVTGGLKDDDGGSGMGTISRTGEQSPRAESWGDGGILEEEW